MVREAAVEELTRAGLRFRIRVEGGPEAPATAVSGVTLARCNGYFEVEAESIGALNAFVDALRRDGRLLTEVTPVRSDLEDVFVKLVEGEAALPVAGDGGAK